MEFKEEPMIDIHSHILPNLDDGARSMQIAVQMLQNAYEQGVRAIIATPHYDQEKAEQKETILAKLEALRMEAAQIGSDLKIYQGNEIYFEESCMGQLQEEQICTLAGGRYILVEFSVSEDYNRIYSGMKDLILEGYCPVIAHMERYACLSGEKSRIRRLIDLGCYLQVNAESCLGGFLSKESRNVRQLLEEGYIHFIASDAHNLKERRCRLGECRSYLEKKLSGEKIKQIFYRNPKKILENKYI